MTISHRINAVIVMMARLAPSRGTRTKDSWRVRGDQIRIGTNEAYRVFYSKLTLFVVALMFAIVVTSPAVPQGVEQGSEPGLVALTIDIWPEYDDPRVLVIYDGMLASDDELPAEVTFAVPADAQVHMAGGIAANGGHLHADFDTRLREDGLMEVSYAPQAPHLYMEFYYDPLSGDDARHFTYPVMAPFDVDSLMVRVQEPLRATAFELAPAAEGSMQDNRGLDYHLVRRGDLSAGSVTPVTVSYTKMDRQPSVTTQEAPAVAQSEHSEGSPWRRARTWILVILAAGFFGVGFFKMFSRPRAAGPLVAGASAATSGGRTRSRRSHAESGSPGPAQFCSQCGRPLAPEHRYCGGCGAPVGG